MLLRNLTKWTLAASVAIAGVALNANKSEAFHHGWGSSSSGGSWGSSSSGGSWGSYGCSSSGGSSSSGGWYNFGSWGSSSSGGSSSSSSGGWGHHHAYYGSWGSSSSGGCSSSGGSSSSGGVVFYEGAPAMPAPPAMPNAPSNNSAPSMSNPPAPGSEVPPTPMPGAMYRSLGGAQVALLNITVPAEAKIFVNGNATTSTGTQRQFVSRGLEAGNKYAYEVKAEIVRDGQTITETKSVTLGTGEQASLAFNFDGNKDAPVTADTTKTKLTIHVPADAKVTLAGRDTTSTGDVREYTTTKLTPGAQWNDYTVRVVANVDGREVTKEETIKLIGGENRELNFDFNSPAVASNATVSR